MPVRTDPATALRLQGITHRQQQAAAQTLAGAIPADYRLDQKSCLICGNFSRAVFRVAIADSKQHDAQQATFLLRQQALHSAGGQLLQRLATPSAGK
jgi:hypothetical protein